MPPDVDPLSLAPRDAAEFLRDKLRLPTRAWTDIWEGQHARAFVIAGAQSEALLADFHGAVQRAIDDGTTLGQFRADFDDIVQRHGWSYRGGRNWRSRVILDTNLRTAYQAGRWQRIQAVKARRPWLRYVAVRDARTRPEHLAWHGTVLPVDHAFWHTHYPPNGWYCRCSVQQLSDRDLERMGLTPSETPPIGLEPWTITTPDGDRVIQVPKGIDAGFGYNVGEAGFGRGAQALALERHGPWDGLTAPGAPAYDLSALPIERPRAQPGRRVPVGDEAALRSALRAAIGGDDVVLTDPVGARVHLGQAIADHILADTTRWDGREAFWPLLREVVEAPAEIWIGFARSAVSGRVALRRRYVRAVQLTRDRGLVLVADADGREWSGVTFYPTTPRGALATIRTGYRLWPR